MLYRWIIRPLLFRLEPERAHRLTIALLKIVQWWVGLKRATKEDADVVGLDPATDAGGPSGDKTDRVDHVV